MNFKYGDLIVKCDQCGEEQVIEEMVTDGRAIYLFNSDESFLKLSCSNCKTSMQMRMREAQNVDPDLLIEDAVVIEETINPTIINEEPTQEVPTEEVV